MCRRCEPEESLVLNIEESLKTAVEHHKAGRWIEAHKLYKQVLAIDPDEPDALRLMGQLVFAWGNAPAAADLIRKAIKLRPGVVDFHIDLARVCMAQAQYSQAVASLHHALELDPFKNPQTHFELARALSAVGADQEALNHVEISLQQKPTAEAIALLGSLLLATHRVQQAVDRLHAAAELAPDRPEILSTYALALQHRGDYELAESNYRAALKLNPNFAEVRCNLGYLLILRRLLPEALAELKIAVELRPQYPQAHHNLALAYTGLGQIDAALASYRTALEQDPRRPDTWEALGRVLLDMRQFKAAVDAFTKLIALKPNAQAYILIGIAHAGLEDMEGSIAAVRKAVELAPLSTDTHDALGGELQWAGQLDEAMAELRRALELDAINRSAHSKLVYTMLMSNRVTPEQILAEHVEWGRRQTRLITPLRKPRNMPDPNRKLRVGYISPNFRNQAVSSFVLPILQHHDRSNIDIYCYSDVAVPDDITKRFQSYANQWHDCTGMSDEQLARQIRADRIDILVELTGHLGKGRLLTLAHRPAPVQISYIGYQGTTGVPTVDYVLTDEWADPTGIAEKNYVEKPYRLPETFFVYEPPGDAPLVGPLPARFAGHVTFGCLNAICKATPRAVALWAKVMSAVPDSKMILSSTRLEETNQRILDGFAAGGISADRIQLVQRCSPQDYMRRYNTIDIALDPIPFNGHTTTCDAAWMGCPTVSLSGQIYAHRYGGSVLRNLNLPELATESEEAYIAAATGLATNLNRLADLRTKLRFEMQKSVITDGPRFTKNLEAAYREMWRSWCRAPES
jgi:protein O-GlcNAc transferase